MNRVIQFSDQQEREQDKRLMAYLLDFYDGASGCNDNEPVGPINMDTVDALLASIDADPDDRTADKPSTISPVLLVLIEKKQRELKRDYDERRPHLRKGWREDQRAQYAAERSAEGKKVRAYNHHPHIPGESDEERRRRLHCEGSRTRAGKCAATVRSYDKLDSLTLEEKRARKKRQDAEANARRTERKRAERAAAKERAVS